MHVFSSYGEPLVKTEISMTRLFFLTLSVKIYKSLLLR